MAVVRISGSRSLDALKKMTSISKLEPRKAFLRKIRDPETGEVIDNGLCLWFPGVCSSRTILTFLILYQQLELKDIRFLYNQEQEKICSISSRDLLLIEELKFMLSTKS